jgi:hypothetical protein
MRRVLAVVAVVTVAAVVAAISWPRSSTSTAPNTAPSKDAAISDESRPAAARTPSRVAPPTRTVPAAPRVPDDEPPPAEVAPVTEPPAPAAEPAPVEADAGPPESQDAKRDRRVKAAKWLLRKERFEEAAEAGKELVARYPHHVAAYEIAVPALCAIGESELAQDYLSRVKHHRNRRQIARTCAELGATVQP